MYGVKARLGCGGCSHPPPPAERATQAEAGEAGLPMPKGAFWSYLGLPFKCLTSKGTAFEVVLNAAALPLKAVCALILVVAAAVVFIYSCINYATHLHSRK